jgi:MSHA pilin protein MshC
VTGFTMVEFVVVLLLLGILAAVGGSRYFGMQAYAARAWTDKVTATARYARVMAIATRSQKVRLTLNAASVSVVLAADCTTAASIPVVDPSGGAVMNQVAPNGATLSVVGRALPFTVCFDGLGRPRDTANAAGALLTSVTTLQVTGGGMTLSVYLEPDTGFVHF